MCPSGPGARTISVVQGDSPPFGAAGDYFGPNCFSSTLYGVASLGGNNTVTAQSDDALPKITDITDGTSNTLLVAEQAGRADYDILGRKQATCAPDRFLPLFALLFAS